MPPRRLHDQMRLYAAIAVIIASTGVLPAQAPSPRVESVVTGSRVKVITTETSSDVIGRIIQMDASELVIEQAKDSVIVRLPRATVQRLLLSTKHTTNRSRIKGGILYGGAVGLGAAAIIGMTSKPVACDSLFGEPAPCGEANLAEKLATGALSALLTVPLGAGLGILMSLGGDRETWIERRVAPQTSILERGQGGVGVSIRW